MKKITFIVIILIILGIFFSYSFYSSALNYSLDPASKDRVTVTIEKGSSASAIADKLYEKDLIRSPFFFRFYLKQNNLADKLKAGHFIFQKDNQLKDIVNILVEGKSNEFPITLLEGWTVEQMAEKVAESELTTKSDFLECIKTCSFDFEFLPKTYLEGYLYPDTYFVNSESYSNSQFISRMLSNFSNHLTDEDWDGVIKSGRSFNDIIIMASIVEREERDPDERPTVAGILWNRFDDGVGLGADATVLYALKRTKGGLSYEDLQIDSPYNTRKYAGLPPTPISNPSISSIRAAIFPKDSDYYYYLHDSDGQVHYARTLEDHNINKEKFL